MTDEKALVPVQPDLMTLSRTLLESKMLPATLTAPAQVAAIILRGKELGIGPMEALTSLNVIRGKVASSTQLMLALIYRSGLLEDIEMVRGDPAVVTMKRKGMTPHTVEFGREDAKRAKLLRTNSAYLKWPHVMYLWRAIAICARVVFPDVIGAVYSPDELGVEMRHDIVDSNVVNGEIVPPVDPGDLHTRAKALAKEEGIPLLEALRRLKS